MWFEQVLTRGLQHAPDQVCLRDVHRDVTWRCLDHECRALAACLLCADAQPGDRVIVLSGNSVEMFEAYFACALAGLVAVPLDPTLTDPEASYVVANMDPALALADARGRTQLGRLNPDLTTLPIESVAQLPDPTVIDLPATRLTDPVVVFQTSATTGRPKGVVADQRYFQFQALSWAAETRTPPRSVFLSAAPLFHGSVIFAFSYLAALGVVAILDAFTPRAFINAVERWKPDATLLVPAMTTLLLKDRRAGSLRNGSLKWVMSGGAPASEQLMRAAGEALGVPLHTILGTTECGVVLHRWPEDGRVAAGHDGGVCAGRPLPGFSARVVNENGDVARPDEIGLIEYAGDSVMRGYWNNGEATAKAVVDGWLLTGDLGYQDSEGFVWLVDRRLDLILRGGQNVYPAEIERVLHRSPQVDQAVVVAAPSADWGQTPVAFIESHDEELDVAALTALCRSELASYKMPSRFLLVPSLPRNSLGKVQREVLRQRLR